MKKFLFWGLAALALTTACNKSEVVDQPNPQVAIGFETFSNKPTRAVAEVTSGNIDAFKVWGSVTDDITTTTYSNVFEAQEVTKSGTAWSYDPLRYWATPIDNTKTIGYSFTALAPADRVGKANEGHVASYEHVDWTTADDFLGKYHGLIKFNNEAAVCNVDLVWANKKESYNVAASIPAQTHLTFNHLLSRVNIKFVNAFPGSTSKIAVTNLSLNSKATGELCTGTYPVGTTVDNMEWTNLQGSFTKPFAINSATFDNANPRTSDAYCIIPSQTALTVTFTVSLYTDTQLAGTWNHTVNVTLDEALKCGYSYTLVATIDASNINPDDELKPINFTVDGVNGWTSAGDISITD